MARANQINMAEGSLLKKTFLFAFPLILTNLLQFLYNAADIIVVGNFAGKEALAAVGSTTALINLIVNVFINLPVGTSVLMSKSFGAKDIGLASKTLHTSVAISFIGGIVAMILGISLSGWALSLMQTPPDVIDGATLYVQIYFLGMPGLIFYNFGAAALRSVGDTKHPLMYLTLSGFVNVALNLVLVIGFRMGVAGVAIATIVSQYMSAVLVWCLLVKTDGYCHLDVKQIKIHKQQLVQILKLGIPSGIQSSFFSISNVMIQSSVNSFGSAAIVAGNSASLNVEGIVLTAMNAMYTTAITAVGQCVGAKKYSRINKSTLCCCGFDVVIGVLFGVTFLLFAEPVISIYSSEADVIAVGANRLTWFSAAYIIAGVMDTIVGAIRGMGTSFLPMCVSLIGICGFRIVWVSTVFAHFHTLESLYISYPVSWMLTTLMQLVCYFIYKRKLVKSSVALD